MRVKQIAVFCQDCWFYERMYWDICDAPENLGDSYRAPAAFRIRCPSIINAKNDCRWFKPKTEKLNSILNSQIGGVLKTDDIPILNKILKNGFAGIRATKKKAMDLGITIDGKRKKEGK